MHVMHIERLSVDQVVYDIDVGEEECFRLANGVVVHNSRICIARNGGRYTLPNHDPIGQSYPFNGGIPYHWG
jgi:hypothetical protein